MVRVRDWAWALLLASGPPQAQSQGPPLTGRGWLTKTRVQNQGPGRQGVCLPAHPWGLNWLRVTSDWVSPASRSVSPGETFFSNSRHQGSLRDRRQACWPTVWNNPDSSTTASLPSTPASCGHSRGCAVGQAFYPLPSWPDTPTNWHN